MRISLLAVAAVLTAAGSMSAAADPLFSYYHNSLAQSKIRGGYWTLHQATIYENYDANGIVPPSTQTAPPYVGTGTPYKNYCLGVPVGPSFNSGLSPMQPFYFPFVMRRDHQLVGLFDYRPRNLEEATVEAVSNDWGATWEFRAYNLGLDPYCPWDETDPDNQYVNVNGVKTAYGADKASAADNGLGHPTLMSIAGKKYIYNLNRANGHIDSDPLVVHLLNGSPTAYTANLPAYGFVSPLGSGGYPTLEGSAMATAGLVNPDAMLGSITLGRTRVVAYVEKSLNADKTFPPAQICPATPSFALTNLVNGKPRKTNDDVTTVRIATTTDGINFTDVGAAIGLNDPTTVALNGIRYLGSGSLIALSDGRYGLFFGAGNCLDNDSDGFHIIGYAETVARVEKPSDLLNWKIVNGFDNPILSTDTVTDLSKPASPRPYPLNPPVVSASLDLLTAAQVAPYTPPAGGYGANFFSGRVYDPQATAISEDIVNIVFAGYNTPQPSNNLGDYRSIGRFMLKTKPNYFKQAPGFNDFGQ